jgi:uncharacterized protein (DUF433 family)
MDTILYSPEPANHPDIVSDPDVVFGEPRIEGTNITVHLLLQRLAKGDTVEQLHEVYPRMPANSIPAALAYAKEVTEGRLPEVWAPIIGEPIPAEWHVYAGLTEEEIDDVTEVIREARKPLTSLGRP